MQLNYTINPSPSILLTSTKNILLNLVQRSIYDTFKTLFTVDRRLMLGYQTEDIIQLIAHSYQ